MVNCFRSLSDIFPMENLVFDIEPGWLEAMEKFVKYTHRAFYDAVGKTSQVQFPMPAPDPSVSPGIIAAGPEPHTNTKGEVFPCLLVMAGSVGGLILLNEDGTSRFVALTSRCGKTIMAMASMFLGVKHFDDIVQVAQKGTRSNIDLEMAYLALKSETNTEDVGDFVVATYGKGMDKSIDDFRREDIMRAIVGHVISDLTQFVALKAESLGTQRVYFCGSLITHPFIRKEILYYLAVQKVFMPESEVKYNFLRHGGHYAAIGSMLDNHT